MSNMIHKDTQISNVLQYKRMSDDQKQKLFNAELERYLGLRQQKDSQNSNVHVVNSIPHCGRCRFYTAIHSSKSHGPVEPIKNKT